MLVEKNPQCHPGSVDDLWRPQRRFLEFRFDFFVTFPHFTHRFRVIVVVRECGVHLGEADI